MILLPVGAGGGALAGLVLAPVPSCTTAAAGRPGRG